MRITVAEGARVPLTMQISQGLVDPNQSCKSSEGKGKTVNIPLLIKYAWRHKFSF